MRVFHRFSTAHEVRLVRFFVRFFNFCCNPQDLIHDLAYDFYGKRIASCSSDQTIKVWDLDHNNEWVLSASWKVCVSPLPTVPCSSLFLCLRIYVCCVARFFPFFFFFFFSFKYLFFVLQAHVGSVWKVCWAHPGQCALVCVLPLNRRAQSLAAS